MCRYMNGGAGDGSSTSSQKCNQIYGRISSYQSLTSDTDYADAEEEWESEVVFSPPSKQPAVPLPSMSYFCRIIMRLNKGRVRNILLWVPQRSTEQQHDMKCGV
ncbi:hypothetical protein NECAME_09597 [Necator americanus]|uniref:Uncharacterized protein n=1 Tax=Necator americanus TaxID=51031 RepID=W2TFR2_NECAM|nr:hypothetical protein NECAME_09597 [Necator americanus]ETN79842.1 hypothetical protein NECAME_09597 [Necator americanus]